MRLGVGIGAGVTAGETHGEAVEVELPAGGVVPAFAVVGQVVVAQHQAGAAGLRLEDDDDPSAARRDGRAAAASNAVPAALVTVSDTGPYQLQATIAAVHDEAPTAEETDWPQILALYDVLTHVAPGPMVTLSRAVALAMVHGPKAGLALLGTLDSDDRMAHTHRLEAVRAHLLERAGNAAAARESYLRAARATASTPEQRYLAQRAARLHQLR